MPEGPGHSPVIVQGRDYRAYTKLPRDKYYSKNTLADQDAKYNTIDLHLPSRQDADPVRGLKVNQYLNQHHNKREELSKTELLTECANQAKLR